MPVTTRSQAKRGAYGRTGPPLLAGLAGPSKPRKKVAAKPKSRTNAKGGVSKAKSAGPMAPLSAAGLARLQNPLSFQERRRGSRAAPPPTLGATREMIEPAWKTHGGQLHWPTFIYEAPDGRKSEHEFKPPGLRQTKRRYVKSRLWKKHGVFLAESVPDDQDPGKRIPVLGYCALRNPKGWEVTARLPVYRKGETERTYGDEKGVIRVRGGSLADNIGEIFVGIDADGREVWRPMLLAPVKPHGVPPLGLEFKLETPFDCTSCYCGPFEEEEEVEAFPEWTRGMAHRCFPISSSTDCRLEDV